MDLSGAWDYIQWVACERLKHNKTCHHVSVFGPEIETLGAAGELAARRFFGLNEELHTRFDGGTDFLLEGLHIDVKTTVLTRRIQRRFLQWPHWKPVKADLVLMTAVNPDRKTAVVIGYATKAEILKAPVNVLRAYPCYEIAVQELHPASDLLTLQHRPSKGHPYRRSFGQAPG